MKHLHSVTQTNKKWWELYWCRRQRLKGEDYLNVKKMIRLSSCCWLRKWKRILRRGRSSGDWEIQIFF